MEATPPKFVEKVLQFWRAHGVPYADGVSEEDLNAFERRTGLELPPQMRAFYLAANGLEDYDEHYFDLWALSELRRVHGVASMVAFADMNVDAWEYAIELDGTAPYKKGAVYAIQGDAVEIASSLEQFFDLYISNDSRLYPVFWQRNYGTTDTPTETP